MGLTNVTKMLALACPPPVLPAKRPTVPPPPPPPPLAGGGDVEVDVLVDEHRRWLDGLSLHDLLRYDRAFGQAWFAGSSKEDCRVIARKAVEGSCHVGAGSNISRKAEQVRAHAPARRLVAECQEGQGGQDEKE